MYVGGFKVKKNKVRNIGLKKTIGNVEIGILIMMIMTQTVHAEGEFSKALFPLVRVLQDLAEPVAYGFMVKGFMQMMAGDEHSGGKTIKTATAGFIGIQFIPRIFSLIRTIQF